MLQAHHYKLLDLLSKSPSGQARNEALWQLQGLEAQGNITEIDLLQLLGEENQVIQLYAVGALGRSKAPSGIVPLKELFLKSNNPMILTQLVEAFLRYEKVDFLDVVLERLQPPSWRKKLGRKFRAISSSPFNEDFLREQLLSPALKYLQVWAPPKVEKLLHGLLSHQDAQVRWHTLKVYDQRQLSIDKKTISAIAETDSSRLNRELASIMLEKKRQTN